MNLKLVLTEALILGIVILIIAIPVMRIQEYYYPGDVASPQKYWISTVIIGILAHLLCEYSGINKYYCDHGYACQT
jgi:hypothetical protein